MRASMAAASFALAYLLIGTPALAQLSVPPETILRWPPTTQNRHTHWHWVEVEASGATSTGWEVVTGTATVEMNGKNFRADLRLDPDKQGANIRLSGMVEKDRVRATETLLNTDASPTGVTGTVHIRPLGDWTEQRIIFRGGQSGDASYLGLYRMVARKGDNRSDLGD